VIFMLLAGLESVSEFPLEYPLPACAKAGRGASSRKYDRGNANKQRKARARDIVVLSGNALPKQGSFIWKRGRTQISAI
jgi:hypothetical protein